MQIKISKTLEAIIARAAFNTTKAGLDHSLKDFLTLELLREEGSLAYQLLSSRLKDWELYQIRLRIEREMLAGQQNVPQSPEEYYRACTEELSLFGRRTERFDGPRAAGHRRRPHDGYLARTGDVRHNGYGGGRRPQEVRRGRRLPH